MYLAWALPELVWCALCILHFAGVACLSSVTDVTGVASSAWLISEVSGMKPDFHSLCDQSFRSQRWLHFLLLVSKQILLYREVRGRGPPLGQRPSPPPPFCVQVLQRVFFYWGEHLPLCALHCTKVLGGNWLFASLVTKVLWSVFGFWWTTIQHSFLFWAYTLSFTLIFLIVICSLSPTSDLLNGH